MYLLHMEFLGTIPLTNHKNVMRDYFNLDFFFQTSMGGGGGGGERGGGGGGGVLLVGVRLGG